MQSTVEILNKKISLVYKFNKQSPLFARAAELELEKNNIDEAINILTEGLFIYPDYATAYFLLGKAYSIKGNYFQALNSIKKGSELFPSQKTFEYYFKEINIIKKQRSLFNISRWSDTANKNFSIFTSSNAKINSETEKDSIAETLDKLTDDIPFTEAESQIESDKHADLNSENFILVSETLAKIYIEQGQLKEAVLMYEKLKQKNPDKEQYFERKIEELKLIMDS